MKTYHVGPDGGALTGIDPNTGEILTMQDLEPRPYPAAELRRLCGALAFTVSGGEWLKSRGNFASIRCEGHFESSANPSFRVSPAARQAKEIARMLSRTEALQKRTAKQLKALKRAKTAPAAPATEPASTDAV